MKLNGGCVPAAAALGEFELLTAVWFNQVRGLAVFEVESKTLRTELPPKSRNFLLLCSD